MFSVLFYQLNIYQENSEGFYHINNLKYKSMTSMHYIRKLQFLWMHRSSSAHWCFMKLLCKIHSHFLWLSGLRVVKSLWFCNSPLSLWEWPTQSQFYRLFQTCIALLSSSQFLPVCQYELRSCAYSPVVPVKVIYYIQQVSYQITFKETAHIACQ